MMTMTNAIIIVFLSLVVLVNGSSMQFRTEIRQHGQVSFDTGKTHQTSVQFEARSDQRQPQPQIQLQHQPQPQPHPPPPPQPQPQLHPHHHKPHPQRQRQPQPQPQPDPQPQFQPQPQPQPDPQPDPQPQPQPQLDPQPQPQPQLDPQPLPQPQPQLPNLQVQIPTPLPTQTQMPVQVQLTQQPSSLTDMYLALATSKPQAYLNAHNMFRQKMGVPPLQWDKKLEDYAHNYGLLRANDCALQHSHGQYGENLFWEQYDETTPDQVVKSFTDEQQNYDIVRGECRCQSNSGKCMCGHFTAVIWKTTERVGCAEVKCEAEKGKLVVCSYDPPGNVPGQDPLLRLGH